MVARSWPEENYPLEYRAAYQARGSIRQQAEALRTIFPGLNTTWAFIYGQDWYDSLALPEWVEGPLIYVWWEFFGSYQKAVQQVLTLIETDPKAQHPLSQPVAPRLRQRRQTEKREQIFKAVQPGDVLIVPSQAGKRHRGRCPAEAELGFKTEEFVLGFVAEGCRALLFPERYIRVHQLDTYCAGDQFSDNFDQVPALTFDGSWVSVVSNSIDDASLYCGAASGYWPMGQL